MYKIVSKIRKIERSTNKKLALIADLQGVKLRVGNIKRDSQKIKYNQILHPYKLYNIDPNKLGRIMTFDDVLKFYLAINSYKDKNTIKIKWFNMLYQKRDNSK